MRLTVAPSAPRCSRITYNATLRTQFVADLDAAVPDLYDWSEYKVIYDGNDGTSQPVAGTEATYPQGYTPTADAGASSTGAASAAGSTGTSPSLFGGGARVGAGAGGAWLAGVAGVVGCVALGAGVVW